MTSAVFSVYLRDNILWIDIFEVRFGSGAEMLWDTGTLVHHSRSQASHHVDGHPSRFPNHEPEEVRVLGSCSPAASHPLGTRHSSGSGVLEPWIYRSFVAGLATAPRKVASLVLFF